MKSHEDEWAALGLVAGATESFDLPPAIDPQDASTFLHMLHPGTEAFNLRTFPEATGAKGQAQNHLVRSADLASLLAQFNHQGHGVFALVNAGGHKDRDITRIRAVFLDLDRKHFGSDEACMEAMRFAHEGRRSISEAIPLNWPHATAIVASGGGGWHVYWRVEDCTPAEFKAVQLAIAAKFHGDTAVCNPSRVMRLPGSMHQKIDPVLVRMHRCDETRSYRLADLLERLGVSRTLSDACEPALCTEDPADDPVLSWLEDNGIYRKPGGRLGPAAPVDVICPNVATGRVRHSDPDGLSSTVYMPQGLNGRPRAFHCSHSQCGALTVQNFLRHVGYNDEDDCPAFDSDDGLACRFIAYLDGRVMYARGQWFVWSGAYWRPDQNGVVSLLQEYADRLSRETASDYGVAAGAGDKAAARRLRAAASLLNVKRQVDVMKSAAVKLHVADEALDAAGDFLAVPNGSIDLQSGLLQAASREHYSTCSGAIELHAAAAAPRWQQFLSEVFQGDEDVIAYVQRFVGYCLTGHVREDVMLVGWGNGANGKSVFAEAIRHILGTYVVTADAQLITAGHNGGGPTPEVARLAGKRLCLLNESKTGDRLDDGMVKKLVSSEKLTARHLYCSPFEFYPAAKLFLRTNHRPTIVDDSEAIWRRLHMLPFVAHFSSTSRDTKLLDTLKSEAQGILAWAVRGAVEWYKKGLCPPGLVKEATAGYRRDSDQTADWLSERTEGGGFTLTDELISDYTRFAGLRTRPTRPVFVEGLKNKGVKAYRKSYGRGFEITLKPHQLEDPAGL